MDEVREGQHSNNQSALRNTKSRQRPHYVTKSQKLQLHCPPALAKITRSQDYFYFCRVDYILRLWIARLSKGAMVAPSSIFLISK